MLPMSVVPGFRRRSLLNSCWPLKLAVNGLAMGISLIYQEKETTYDANANLSAC